MKVKVLAIQEVHQMRKKGQHFSINNLQILVSDKQENQWILFLCPKKAVLHFQQQISSRYKEDVK